jgi:cell division protein FtsN
MHFRNSWWLAGAMAATTIATSGLSAQTARDSALYLTAQRMVNNGQAETGRRIVDSLVAAAPAGSGAYAEALYWRATLAASARDSEKDYRRIVVDYVLSPRVPDALLRMGQLESARGDREGALQHFKRLVAEHPESPLRAEASYWVARTYFEQNDINDGCAANADALALVQASNVELKNRIAFQQQRCRGVVVAQAQPAAPAPATPAPVATPAVPATTKGVPVKNTQPPVPTGPPTPPPPPAPRTPPPAPKPTPAPKTAPTPKPAPALAPKPATTRTQPGMFAVQIAAYSTKARADAFAAMLRNKGYPAHVDGTVAPFRVRIGHFSRRADAVAELNKLKAKHIDGFVTQE